MTDANYFRVKVWNKRGESFLGDRALFRAELAYDLGVQETLSDSPLTAALIFHAREDSAVQCLGTNTPWIAGVATRDHRWGWTVVLF